MGAGKDRYEEQKRLKHEAEAARLKMQKTYHEKKEEEGRLVGLIMRAAREFLEGRAQITVSKSVMGDTTITFKMPPASDVSAV